MGNKLSKDNYSCTKIIQHPSTIKHKKIPNSIKKFIITN